MNFTMKFLLQLPCKNERFRVYRDKLESKSPVVEQLDENVFNLFLLKINLLMILRYI